jgi:hypothetical protein
MHLRFSRMRLGVPHPIHYSSWKSVPSQLASASLGSSPTPADLPATVKRPLLRQFFTYHSALFLDACLVV